MYISTVEMYYSDIFPPEIYISLSKWRPPDTKWRPPDISGGRHLQNEMYISSEKMYISTGEMYLKYTSFQLKYISCFGTNGLP